MEIGLILSFLGASILLSLMPGPDNIYVLTESITKGSRNGLFISLGLCTGVLIHTLAAATGISIVFQNSTLAFSILKYLGAAYLFYLAYQASKEKKTDINLNQQEKKSVSAPFFPLWRKGFLMNVLNPKVSLFFIAFLPQFISNKGMHIIVQMILLGLIFMLQALVIFGAIAILSGKLSPFVNNPKFWKITKWSKVAILTILGLSLMLSNN